MSADAPGTAYGVVIDYDPSVWLPGPPAGASQTEVSAWIEGALAACGRDFGVEPEAEAYDYLREMLTGFATAELLCDFRFLRLHSPDDAPLVARLDLVQGASRGEVGATAETYDRSLDLYDRTPKIEIIDEQRALRRLLMFHLDEGVRSIVRYHRRVDEWAVDVLLSCAGADLKATATGLPDLDDLAGSIWVVDAAGNRR